MRHTVSERRKRWFFIRSLVKSFWEHLDKRARRKRAVAVSRPLFAEALEARVMFSASPVPVEQEQPVEEAPVAQEAAEAGPQQGQAADPTVLTQEKLDAVVQAAKQRWIDAGISADQLAALDGLTYEIADLGGTVLAAADGLVVTIDDNGGGVGWFVDATPSDDEEFTGVGGVLKSGKASEAEDRIDLLTAILHEQGHVLGLGHQEMGLMSDALTLETRWLPAAGQADGAVPGTGSGYLVVAETESNDSRAAAQVLSPASFSTDSVSGIIDSTIYPHVTITGAGDGTFDYYAFQATAGDRGIFDIDDNNFDTELFLFDSVGNVIALDDDFTEAGHTGAINPSFINHTFAASGTYTIGVGKFNSSASGGAITGVAPQIGDFYTLHVSIGTPPPPPPFAYSSSAVTYSFEDISGTGTVILPSSDDVSASIAIGFNFPFIGANYSTVYASDNGLLTFTSGNRSASNAALSTSGQGRPTIAPFWDDLDTRGNTYDQVYYETRGTAGVDQRLIVQWDVSRYNDYTDQGRFQAVLFATGDIEFRYNDVVFGSAGTDNGAGATIGIANSIANGAPGNGQVLQISHNTASVSDGTAIRISPTTPTPTTEVTVSGGNLTITDVEGGDTSDNLTIKVDGLNYRITDATNSINQTIAVSSVTGSIIVNGSGGNDTLTIDLSGGPITRNIVFHGGAGGTDTLVVTGGAFGTVTYDATNAFDGVLDFGTFTVTFTGLEPVDMTGSTFTDLVVNVDPDSLVAGTVTTTIARDAVTTDTNRSIKAAQ